MSVFATYRDRRREISTPETLGTYDHMLGFFGGGENWAQHVYDGNDGGRCLVAAAAHVRVSQIDDAPHWLRIAIKEKTGLDSIEQFNDTRSSFDEIKEVIARAKELARAGGAKAVALVGEVLPPVRTAPPSPAPVTALPVVQANKSSAAVAANPWAGTLPQPRRRPIARPSLWDWSD